MRIKMQKHYKQNKNNTEQKSISVLCHGISFHSSERKLMACDHDFCELLFNDMHVNVSLL